MRRGIVHVAFALVAVLGLEACGLADIRSPVADFMRTKPVDPPPPEAPPDVKRLVREGLESVFVASSNPRYIHVSAPHHDPRGMGWTACVRAEVNSANGRPMGVQTYRILISGGAIVDRRRVEPEEDCETESYEPI
jgi:hypothetical protein